jgi:putative ABC transport system permease protein
MTIVPPGILPTEADFHLDTHVLLAALAVTTMAGLVFGCGPAWFAARVDPGESLKEGGRSSAGTGSHRLRRTLITGEFALALSLLAGAGLAIHSFWNLTRVDLGVRTDHVLVFGLNQPDKKFENPEQMNAYNQQMLTTLRGVPGVSSVATVTGLPLRGPSDGMPFTLVGGPSYADPSQRPGTGFQSVSPDYFKTFGIQVVRGRTLTDEDTATSTRVAMVNEEFERRYLKGLDPLRQRVSIEQIIPGLPKLGPAVDWQIVGVFHDVRGGDFRDQFPEVDVPFAQSLSPSVRIGVQTAGDPAAMSRVIASAVHRVDSEIALTNLRTLDQVKQESLGEDRYTMVLFACFALVALLLAAVGIYGLMAFAVSQRTNEIGLRLALGATRINVIRLILKDASILAVIGMAIGIVGSIFVSNTMRSTLYGIAALDFSVLIGVALILFSTALLASYLPARRAAMIEPMRALRNE